MTNSGYYAVQNEAGRWTAHWYDKPPTEFRAYIGPHKTENEALSVCKYRNGD